MSELSEYSSYSRPSSIPSFQPLDKSESSSRVLSNIKITRDMVLYPGYDESQAESSEQVQQTESTADGNQLSALETYAPQLMVIFDGGDLNSALHFLLKSIQNPFADNAVASVLLQESLRKEFVERLQSQLKPLSDEVANNPDYVAALLKLQQLNVEIITADKEVGSNEDPIADEEAYRDDVLMPLLVCDYTQGELGDGTGATGIISLHTFRSTAEAIDICHKETIAFRAVSIWNESLVGAYELLSSMQCQICYLNCCNVSLWPVQTAFRAAENFAIIANSFHYETLQLNGQPTIIVFPICDIIRQETTEEPKEQPPISFLDE